MKVPFSWLKQHVKLEATPAQVADDLVRLGHEVESVEQPRAAVKGVKVGLIESKVSHPDADKLSLLKVNIGEDEALEVRKWVNSSIWKKQCLISPLHRIVAIA